MDAHELGSFGGSMKGLGKSIDYLLILVSEWTSRDWCVQVTLCECECVCVCVCVCNMVIV